MGRVVVFMVASADGFYEGPGRAFDWPVVDEEFGAFAVEQLAGFGGLLFGRITYQGMAAYWPTPEAEREDPRTAALMNAVPKYVATLTLEHADWGPGRILRSTGEIAELREQAGADLGVFGSNGLWVRLLETGLVDEIRIMTMPVALGGGRSLFTGIHSRVHLELTDTRVFRSGNVLLTYRPRPAG
ncbi:dihydrofolate reductase family protein [Kitasatospora camelliae]|uniref:Dihydrofolate reductase family protein n=1 Tax=Kitasatospora camelliae TaxID=3156397 RepID=A0AAU8K6H4_9ACTN